MMLTFAFDALAAYRVTRLVTRDRITAPVRDRFDPEGVVGELIRCSWCTGVWVAAGVVAARRVAPRVWAPAAEALAVAAVVGLIADNA